VGELYLCGHCASQQWRALSAQGWTFWPLGVHAIAPQASTGPHYGLVDEGAGHGNIRRGGRPGQ